MAVLQRLRGETWGTRNRGGGLEQAELVGVGVAKERQTDDVGVFGEEVVEAVIGEEGDGWCAGADVRTTVVGAPGVDAGRDVGEDPSLLMEFADLFELRGEPGELSILSGLSVGVGWRVGIGLGSTGFVGGHLVDVVEDEDAGGSDGRGQGGCVVTVGQCENGGALVSLGKRVGDEVGGEGEEVVFAGTEAVVVAAGVVVAEGDEDGDVGEGGAEVERMTYSSVFSTKLRNWA